VGDIQVGQVKKLKVAQADGTELPVVGFTATTSDASILTVEESADQTRWEATAHAAGSATVHAEGAAAFAGQSGDGSFTVDAAPPLVVTLE
jgi:hypothetical protein